MFIEIIVKFVDISEEEAETFGREQKPVKAEMVINTNSICGFNANDNGNINLRLANGEVHEVLMGYQEFKDIINEVESEEKDVLISGTN